MRNIQSDELPLPPDTSADKLYETLNYEQRRLFLDVVILWKKKINEDRAAMRSEVRFSDTLRMDNREMLGSVRKLQEALDLCRCGCKATLTQPKQSVDTE